MGNEVGDFSTEVLADGAAHMMHQVNEVYLRKQNDYVRSHGSEISSNRSAPRPQELTTSSFLRKPVKQSDRLSMVVE